MHLCNQYLSEQSCITAESIYTSTLLVCVWCKPTSQAIIRVILIVRKYLPLLFSNVFMHIIKCTLLGILSITSKFY